MGKNLLEQLNLTPVFEVHPAICMKTKDGAKM